MKIQEITDQIRNDFTAIMECEYCAATQELRTGYDDPYYHNHIIPAMKCKSCGKSGAGE